MLHYQHFRASAAGQALAARLADEAVVAAMEEACLHGLPAVAAIDEWAADALPGLGETERQHAGRMVRDVLAARGWRVASRHRPRLRPSRLFRTGAVYVRANASNLKPPISAAPEDRLARARALLAAGRIDPERPLDTVDAFLAERRTLWGSR